MIPWRRRKGCIAAPMVLQRTHSCALNRGLHSLPAPEPVGLALPMNAASGLEGTAAARQNGAHSLLCARPAIATGCWRSPSRLQAAVIVTNLAGSMPPAKVPSATLVQSSRTQSGRGSHYGRPHLFGEPHIDAPRRTRRMPPQSQLPLRYGWENFLIAANDPRGWAGILGEMPRGRSVWRLESNVPGGAKAAPGPE